MKVKLSAIACARSGDKGAHANIGVIFKNNDLYLWGKEYLTCDIVKSHFKSIVKGEVIRFHLDNINSLNFILHDSLGGGGSESLLNDAQGKTYGQAILMIDIEIPNKLRKYINE